MSTTKSNTRKLIRSGIERKKVLLRTNLVLLFALSMMIFVVPVMNRHDNLLTSILLCILVLSGLFAADFSRSAFRSLFSLGVLVILVTLLNLFLPDYRTLKVLTFFLNTLFFIIVTVALVSHIASTDEVYGSTMLCAINSYLLIGLTLSILFLILDIFVPDSFRQIDSGEGSLSSYLYYGFVTLSTLGYGDITPNTALARSLATFTALFGQLYLVIIMALIIGKYLSGKRTVK